MVTVLQVDRIHSPIGEIVVVVDDGQLCALDFGDCTARLQALLQRRYGETRLDAADDPHEVSSHIRAYLAGDYASLDAIRVRTAGTPFQEQVWAALRTIPVGSVWTYGQLAARIGRPTAMRAVGAANGRNPVALVLPCHRLVGANAALTGYGGGLARKQWLLAHEGVAAEALRL